MNAAAQALPFSDVDIYIVGLGIVHLEQITPEVDNAISKSKTTLFVERGHGIKAYLQSKCRNIIDLTGLYSEDGDRQETYRRMAAATIQAALDNPPVTLALYGHPLIYSYPPFLVKEMAKRLALRTKTLPGISALDCLFVDLGIDPAMNGLQMFEATELLLRDRPLFPDVPAVLWQIGALETGLFSTRPSTAERFTRFTAHLLKFYSRDHTVFAVHSSTHPLLRSEIFRFKIDEMESYAPALHAGFTLYIPPVSMRPIADQQLVQDSLDPSYLRTVTSEVFADSQ